MTIAALVLAMTCAHAYAGAPGIEKAAAGTPQTPPPRKAVAVEEADDIIDMTTVSDWSADSWSDPRRFPVLDRGINLFTTRTIPQWRPQFTIDHRASEPLKEKPFADFLGFDAGSLKIGLGLRLGILRYMDVGITRLNGTIEPFDTYEFDARLRFLEQDRHGVSAAFRGGGTWFYIDGAPDDWGLFAQLIVERVFWRRLLWNVSALYHSNSTGEAKKGSDNRWSFAPGTLLELRLAQFLAIDLEGIFSAAGYRAAYPYYATSLKFITNRHTFSILFTTSPYLTADGVVANTTRSLPQTVFGFKITREF